MVIRYNLNLTNVVHSSMKFSFILSNYEQSSLARLVLSLSLSLSLSLWFNRILVASPVVSSVLLDERTSGSYILPKNVYMRIINERRFARRLRTRAAEHMFETRGLCRRGRLWREISSRWMCHVMKEPEYPTCGTISGQSGLRRYSYGFRSFENLVKIQA